MNEAGLSDLLDCWERFASSLRHGYEFGLDDYLNDVDIRQRIESAVRGAQSDLGEGLRTRLAAADRAVREATTAAPSCLWGSANALEHGWTLEVHWWYFAMPLQRERGFDRDLASLS